MGSMKTSKQNPEALTVLIQTMLRPSLARHVKEAAKKRGMTVSAFVRWVLSEKLR